jgi:hypothetical protein
VAGDGAAQVILPAAAAAVVVVLAVAVAALSRGGEAAGEAPPPRLPGAQLPLALPRAAPLELRAPLYAQRLRSDGRTLDLVYGLAGRQRADRIVIRARREAVYVSVVVRSPRSTRFDLNLRCATVSLDASLGARVVRDGGTRRPIPSFARATPLVRDALPTVCD